MYGSKFYSLTHAKKFTKFCMINTMPAHIKSTLIGVSQTIPISQGCLNLGTWQGLYLCEHRDNASSRTIIVTIQGE
ncbi:secondary thiamine-phosphate synthase enzyme YjbQ [Shewanella sp. ER-Te-42B-Light]|uniref:Secondary thiamine-phosphate synthase enzyme YjbQ n=1 Tax=Shewanella metallivivens TaxID=2872342 RepID=A0ABT5TMV8_9GAMM|nr:secondary thiamine-phosphate synthase enzyme YjbQ [Shewanella metallivivens]MDD8059204.1 secondary thiamine-phosphate synthase enzyme YjbQ [Shewanella metallivivens]